MRPERAAETLDMKDGWLKSLDEEMLVTYHGGREYPSRAWIVQARAMGYDFIARGGESDMAADHISTSLVASRKHSMTPRRFAPMYTIAEGTRAWLE